MSYLQGILAALGLIKEVLDGAKAFAGFVKESRNEAWFQQSAQVFSKMATAKTPDERKKVVSDLARLWGGIG